MARIYGLNGVLRGRQGNNIFSVQNGTQVVKAYQPVVSNPRTIAQQEQRTKFALAGRMSGATPLIALSGMMGSNPRAKRARFVKLVTNSATVAATESGLRASVLLNGVTYSEGSVAQYSSAPVITAAWGTGTAGMYYVVVTCNRASVSQSATPAGYGELLVVALYDSVTGNLDEVQAVERPIGNSSQNFSLNFRQSTRRDVFVASYICPFIRDTRSGSLSTSFVGGSETQAFLDSSTRQLISAANWGQSVFAGAIGVLGGETSHDAVPNPDRGTVVDPDNGDVMKAYKKK